MWKQKRETMRNYTDDEITDLVLDAFTTGVDFRERCHSIPVEEWKSEVSLRCVQVITKAENKQDQ